MHYKTLHISVSVNILLLKRYKYEMHKVVIFYVGI